MGTNACHNRHSTWSRPALPFNLHHCHKRMEPVLQRQNCSSEFGHKTSAARLDHSAWISKQTTNAVHQSDTSIGRLWGLLQCIKEWCRQGLVWTREKTPTNCLASGVPTRYPTTAGIAGEPTWKNFQFQLGNGGAHFAVVGVGKLCKLIPHACCMLVQQYTNCCMGIKVTLHKSQKSGKVAMHTCTKDDCMPSLASH